METSRSILNQLLCLGMSLILSLTLIIPFTSLINLQRIFLTKNEGDPREHLEGRKGSTAKKMLD